MKKIYLSILVIGFIFYIGCSKDNLSNNVKESDNAKKISVAVSIIPEETFVKAVGGDLVDVITMIPPGGSPTNYQPTIQQMTKLSDSKLYFSIGVATEEANIKPKLKEYNENINLVKLEDVVSEAYEDRFFEEEEHEDEHVDEHVDEHEEEHEDEHVDEHEEEHEHEHEGKDPHIWMSPKRVVVMIEKIRDELINIDNENKEIYNDNAKKYIDELKSVDSEIKTILKGNEKESFIIFHPSMGYFAEDYNLEMVAIEESGKEATAKKLENVIDFAKKKKIKFVFYQEEFDDSQAKTIADEIGGSTLKIAPLDSDYIENLKEIANSFKKVLR